jgi:hypothetical protein
VLGSPALRTERRKENGVHVRGEAHLTVAGQLLVSSQQASKRMANGEPQADSQWNSQRFRLYTWCLEDVYHAAKEQHLRVWFPACP